MRKFSVESTRNISRKFWVVTLGPLLIVILLGILESKLGSNFSWIGSISKTIIVYLVIITVGYTILPIIFFLAKAPEHAHAWLQGINLAIPNKPWNQLSVGWKIAIYIQASTSFIAIWAFFIAKIIQTIRNW